MRGIAFAEVTGPGVELVCDCGASTVLVGDISTEEPGDGVEVIYVPATGGEVAFTCPGCGTAHWLMIGPLEAAP